ncbi:MAG: cytochrome c3 family protein [Syntrophomonadaceae bacterium]|nr:cytochrome c3 family protein [Syntrophomonadaceae bacterium]MDD3889562.1 cytochrome c3 family protein [Syntrophomonadaceae bacterium]MDD4550132.1 cytochrome c3 family protein [Syntrophomonadaceae bacterium]
MRLSRIIFWGMSLVLCSILIQFPANICLAQNDPLETNPQNVETPVEETCASCHQQEWDAFAAGIHSENGLDCLTCHQAHDTGAGVHEDPMSDPKNIPDSCGACHSQEIVKSYNDSFHGRALSLGSSETADCTSCHNAHEIVKSTDPNSPVAVANLPDTCGQCHEARDNYAVGTEHKLLDPDGPGAPQYWTFKFFIWLTILSVVGLILHMEMELLYLLRKARKKA